MTIRRAFRALAAFSVHRRRLVVFVSLGVMILAAGLAATRLQLRTSNLDLIDPGLPAVERFRQFAEEFGTPNVLVVVLEGEDQAALEAAAARLGPALRATRGVRGVVDRAPFDDDVLRSLGVDRYITSYDRRLFFLFVQPDDPHSSAETIAPFVDGVRAALERAGLEAAGVRAGLTGLPAYALDDRDVIQRDLGRLSLISLALILLVFATTFGAIRRPLLAGAALLAAVVATLGFTALYPGHLTLLSAFFASILFGLGIDYGIHVVSRVEESVAAGMTEARAIPEAVGAVAPGLATGALTTALVFYSMRFCGFLGFEELGMIAGTGVLVCLLAMLTLLPALLALFPPRPAGAPGRRGDWIGDALLALQRTPLTMLLLALALIGTFLGGPGFDADYLNLQPRNSEAVRLERAMVRESDLSPQFAAFTRDSMEEVRKLSDRLLDEPTVGDVHSMADIEDLADAGGNVDELSPSYLAGLRSDAGRYAVYAYPTGDVWDPEQRRGFLSAMEAIDPQVTGMPFLGEFMVSRSRRALRITAWLAGLLLLLCVLADLRRPGMTALAVAPAFLTVSLMHALMRLLHLPFNPLNIMALPVVLGIAVDDGVHIVHRFIEEGGDLTRTLRGTGRSVVLTSLTTVVAFGALSLTAHRGLASFSLAVTLGVAVALVLSALVLPGILSLFGAPRIVLQRRRLELG